MISAKDIFFEIRAQQAQEEIIESEQEQL